jgi:hypothetical protein
MPDLDEDVEAFKNLALAEMKAAEERGAARERAQIIRWCRTYLRHNRNAQLFADSIEQGDHYREVPDDLPG